MTLILNLQEVEQAINMRTIIDQIEKGLVEEYHGHVSNATTNEYVYK